MEIILEIAMRGFYRKGGKGSSRMKENRRRSPQRAGGAGLISVLWAFHHGTGRITLIESSVPGGKIVADLIPGALIRGDVIFHLHEDRKSVV